MATAPCTPVLRQLRRLALGQDAAELTDTQLLHCFLNDRDEAAFAALVRRHGPMVLGVCRRVLRDLHDAEDAFQATFLVLLRKARSIAEPERLGNWLYGVAFYTARNARVARTRRQSAERRFGEQARPETKNEPAESEWRSLLDRELSGLPEKYRVPLVLCELEGRPRHEAARQLGCAEGTLSSRLARGRALLRQRLLRRGVSFSAASLGAVLGSQTAAAVSPALLGSTVQSATALTAGMGSTVSTPAIILMEGVLQAMLLTKLKIATVWLLIVGILGTGMAVFTHEALAGKPPASEAKAEKAGEKNKPPAAPSLNGVIQEVDAAKQTITLSTGDKSNRQNKTLPLAKEMKVLLRDGLRKDEPAKEGKLTDLSAGMSATLQLSADEKMVVAIIPAPLNATGGVKSVDPTQKTITIQVKDKSGGGGERTFQLVDEAKVLLNDGLKKGDPDTEGKLADLVEGSQVQLHVSLTDPTKALAVRVQGGSLHGAVAGLDQGNSTLTLTVKEDGQKVDKILSLAKNARVDSELVVGDMASVRLSVFDKTKVVAVQKVKGKDKENE